MTDRVRVSSRPPESPVAFWVCIGYLGLCLVLGGGTRQALVAEGLLQLLALPVLAWGALRLSWEAQPKAAFWLAVWAALVIGWLATQLIPLPPSWWSALAGRESLAAELAFAGVDQRWRPISLDWQTSVRALFAWLPLLALGLLVLGLTSRQRVNVLRFLLAAAVAAALLGLAQLSTGPDSALRWHEITNQYAAVGPFANRNHLATFLASLLPLGAAAFLAATDGSPERRPLRLTLAILAGVVILVGLAMTRSRAGVAVGCLSLLGVVVMAWSWRRWRHRMDAPIHGLRAWVFVAALVIGFLLVQYALVGLLRSFDKDAMEDRRWSIAEMTLEVIEETGRLGTGGGTFPLVYGAFEPAEQRGDSYVNRAHNDWLEWWLEGGIPLFLLMLAGLAWLGVASWQAFRIHRNDAIWFQAASVGAWVILVHSLFDYPLRTTAMNVTMAALLVCVAKSAQPVRRSRRKSRRDPFDPPLDRDTGDIPRTASHRADEPSARQLARHRRQPSRH